MSSCACGTGFVGAKFPSVEQAHLLVYVSGGRDETKGSEDERKRERERGEEVSPCRFIYCFGHAH